MEIKMLKSLILLLGTNFIIYGLSTALSFQRPLFNIDYILIAGLIVLKYKKVANVLWVIVFICDLLLCIRQIFPFFRLEDIIYISRFIWISSIYYQLACLIFIVYAIFHCYIHTKIEINKIVYIAILIVTSLSFAISSIYSSLYPARQFNYISSQVVEFVNFQFYSFQQSLRELQQPLTGFNHSPKATNNLRINLEKNTVSKKGVLLIVAESLGYPNDSIILDQLLDLLQQKVKLENLLITKSHYVAPTVHAELRELCKVQANNLNLKNLENGFENCLAHQFKLNGYETTAMHGALGLMYDRKYWYPRAGFDQLIFQETKKWQTRCYSFPGICDEELSHEISKQFLRPKPQFFYWLTLNSHAIYDSRDIKIDRFNCTKFNIKPNSESCRNLKLQAQFFHNLAKVLNEPQMRGVDIVIVGDHTPAILDQSEKAKVFDSNNVLIINFTVSNI